MNQLTFYCVRKTNKNYGAIKKNPIKRLIFNMF